MLSRKSITTSRGVSSASKSTFPSFRSICRSLAAENLSEMGEYIRVAQLRGSTRAEEWYCMYLSHQSSLTLLLSLVGEPAHVEAEAWRG